MTTLGRAYIEIVADGGAFSESLRREVSKSLDAEMAAAGKQAGRKAGESTQKEFVSGFKIGLRDKLESGLTTEMRIATRKAALSAGRDSQDNLVRGLTAGFRFKMRTALEPQLTLAVQQASRNAGRAGAPALAQGLADGLRRQRSTVATAARELGDEAATALGKGARDAQGASRAIVPEVFERNAALKKAISLGEDIARTLTKAEVDEARRTGRDIDFSGLSKAMERDVNNALAVFRDRIGRGVADKRIVLNFDIAKEALERVGTNAGNRIITSTSETILRRKSALGKAIEAGESDVVRTAESLGKKAGESLEKGLTPSINNVQKKAGVFGRVLSFVFKPLDNLFRAFNIGAGSVAAVTAAVVELLPQLLSLGAAVVQLGGLLLGLPSALGPAALALIGFKLALSGFGAAFKAKDAKAFEDATKNMGVNARKLASILRDLKPQLQGIQKATQDAFAAQIVGNVRAIAAAVIGPLRTGFADLGKHIGTATDNLGKFIASSSGLRLLREWFSSANVGVDSFSRGIEGTLRGISNLNNALKPIVDRLIVRAGDLGVAFGNWLTRISQSGKAAQYFQGALDVLSTLWTLIRNVSSALKSMFDASGQSATSFLKVLDLITGRWAALFGSDKGQQALRTFFQGIDQINTALAPTLDAVGSLAVVLVTALGPALRGVLPLVESLGRGLGDLVKVISPIVEQLGQSIGGIATAITPALRQVGKSFIDALRPALKFLTPVVQILGHLIEEIAPDLISVLGPAFDIVGESVEQVTKTFGDKLIPVWRTDLIPAIKNVTSKLGPLAKALKDIFDKGAPVRQILLDAAAALGKFLILDVVVPALNALAVVLEWLAKKLEIVSGWIGIFSNWLSTLDVEKLKALPGQIADKFAEVAGVIAQWAKDTAKKVPGWLEDITLAIGRWALDVAGKIPGFIATAFKPLVGAFQNFPDNAQAKLDEATTNISDWLKALPDKVKTDVDTLERKIGDWLDKLPGKVHDALDKITPVIQQWLQDLPDKIQPKLDAITKRIDQWAESADWTAIGIKIGKGILFGFVLLPAAIEGILFELSSSLELGLAEILASVFKFSSKLEFDLAKAVFDIATSIDLILAKLLLTVVKFGSQLVFTWAQIWWSLISSLWKWETDLIAAVAKILLHLWEKWQQILRSIVTGVFDRFGDIKQAAVTQVQSMIDSVVGLIGGMPGAIGRALSGLKNAITTPFRSAGGAVMDVLLAIIGGFNLLIGKFGLPGITVPKLPGFRRGGMVGGTGTADNQLILATPGEGVITRSGVRNLGGPAGIAAINDGRIQVPRFANGGVVGGIADAIGSDWAKALGISADLLRFIADPRGWLTDVINSTGLGSMGGEIGDRLRQIPVGLMNAAVNRVKAAVAGEKGNLAKSAATAAKNALERAFGIGDQGGGDAGSDQLGGWISQAIALAGVPASWGPRLRVGILRESGGNPRAINLTDINAQLGHPSIGLMQTIGPTFEAYRLKSLPDNIYDPVANIVAGIRYILARYGSIFNVQQFNPALPPRGYGTGGLVTQPTIARLAERGPELVLPLTQPMRTGQLVRDNALRLPGAGGAGSGSASGAGTVINAPITVNAPQANPELVAYRVSAQIARMASAGV